MKLLSFFVINNVIMCDKCDIYVKLWPSFLSEPFLTTSHESDVFSYVNVVDDIRHFSDI